MLVNWFRNASEKDNKIVRGTGEIAHLGWMERTAEGMAIIVDSEGNFVEKNLSLIQLAEVPEDQTAEFDKMIEEADSTIVALKKELGGTITTLKDELVEAHKVIERLNKKPKPVTPKK